MEAKAKHLEFIQTTINRMSNNSFLLKGWTVAVVGGLLAFGFKESVSSCYLLISELLVFLFWLLDAYYLSQERLFVALYNQVRTKSETQIDFSMKTESFAKKNDWLEGFFSTTLIILYGGLIFLHFIISLTQ